MYFQATQEGNIPLTEEEKQEFIQKQTTLRALAEEERIADTRLERNKRLSETDWTQMNDSPLTDEAKASWATYRTALRDLTTHVNWPNLEDADWPTEPS